MNTWFKDQYVNGVNTDAALFLPDIDMVITGFVVGKPEGKLALAEKHKKLIFPRSDVLRCDSTRRDCVLYP